VLKCTAKNVYLWNVAGDSRTSIPVSQLSSADGQRITLTTADDERLKQFMVFFTS